MAWPIFLNKPTLNNFNDPGHKIPAEPIVPFCKDFATSHSQ